MKNFLFILIWIIYFIFLFILKEWIINKDLTLIINHYISLEKTYYISYIFAIIFILNSIIEKIFNKLLKKETKKSISKHILPILKKILKIIIWTFWLITIISNLWYNVWALLTWAWIWWVALALASQKTIANIFWAINVILNKPFSIWDKIKIWSFEWEVEDIWLIYLKIRNQNWHEILIPNETITSSPIENFSKTK